MPVRNFTQRRHGRPARRAKRQQRGSEQWRRKQRGSRRTMPRRHSAQRHGRRPCPALPRCCATSLTASRRCTAACSCPRFWPRMRRLSSTRTLCAASRRHKTLRSSSSSGSNLRCAGQQHLIIAATMFPSPVACGHRQPCHFFPPVPTNALSGCGGGRAGEDGGRARQTAGSARRPARAARGAQGAHLGTEVRGSTRTGHNVFCGCIDHHRSGGQAYVLHCTVHMACHCARRLLWLLWHICCFHPGTTSGTGF